MELGAFAESGPPKYPCAGLSHQKKIGKEKKRHSWRSWSAWNTFHVRMGRKNEKVDEGSTRQYHKLLCEKVIFFSSENGFLQEAKSLEEMSE